MRTGQSQPNRGSLISGGGILRKRREYLNSVRNEMCLRSSRKYSLSFSFLRSRSHDLDIPTNVCLMRERPRVTILGGMTSHRVDRHDDPSRCDYTRGEASRGMDQIKLIEKLKLHLTNTHFIARAREIDN